MLKKVVYTAIPLLAFGFALFAWYQIDQRQKNKLTVVDFFDQEALVYGSIHDVGTLLRGMERSDFRVLEKIPINDPVLKAFVSHDSIGSIEEWNRAFPQQSLFFTIYVDQSDAKIAWLFENDQGTGALIQQVISAFKKVGENQISMDESGVVTCADYTLITKKLGNYSVFSTSKELVQRLEKNAADPSSNPPSVKRASAYAELNLVWNPVRFKDWTRDLLELDETTSWVYDWLLWDQLDVHFKPQTLYGSSVTKVENWKNLSHELLPAAKEQLKLLPENTSFFAWMNFDGEGYYRAYNKIYATQNELSNFNYLKWIDGEVTFFGADSNYFMMVSSRFSEYDPQLVLEDLNVSKSRLAPDSLIYKDHSSYRLKKLYVGSEFKKFVPSFLRGEKEYQWYTSMGDQILMATSLEGLQSFVDHFTAQRFFLNDQQIENGIDPLHGQQSCFLFYHQLEGLKDHMLASWYQNNFQASQPIFYWSLSKPSEEKVLHHLSWSVKSSTSFADTNSDERSVWEIELDYQPTGNYITFYDPANGNIMLIEGDDQHLHYLRSNGEEIKRVPLSGKLVGNPQFISANKGKQKYLMFNTSKSVYLSDLQGNIHGGFPYASSTEISGTARIFDYENDGNLRIIVPLADGNVQNINKKGEVVDGWVMKKVDESFVSYPRHFIREGKDYMCFFTRSKKLYAVDRRGELRPGFPLDFKGWTGGDVKLSVASTINDSYIRYITEQGQLKRVYFSGKTDAIDLVHESRHFTWDFEDLTGDGKSEFIASRAGYITVYNDVGIEIYSYPADVTNLHTLQVVNKNKSENYLGYILKDKQQLILLDPFGELKKGYPIDCSNLFLTMDVNSDNQRELVFFNKNKLICTQNW